MHPPATKSVDLTKPFQTPPQPRNQVVQLPIPAIRRTRLLPWWELVLHGTCILAGIVLFGLCSRNVYFLDFGQPSLNSILNALQFAAKAHDMILVASLTTMILYVTRYQLCARKGLPLGYLSCALHLSNIDCLLSREFWFASLAHRQFQWFGMLILVATVMTAILGPSSAILMIPDLDWWPVPDPFSGHVGVMYINKSYDILWPSRVNASIVANAQECLDRGPTAPALPPSCPFNMMVEISQWLINNYNRGSPPNLTKSADLGVVRYLSASTENTTSHPNDTVYGYSVGSSAMTHLSRNLDTVMLYAESQKLNMIKPSRPLITLASANKSQPLRRPLVQVQCGFPYDITHAEFINVTFPSDQIHTKSGRPSPIPDLSISLNTTQFRKQNLGPFLDWRDFSNITGRPIIGASVGMRFFSPQLMFDSFEGDEATGLLPCTIESYWIPTTLARDPMFGATVLLDNANPLDVVKSSSLMEQARDLYIDTSYFDMLNTPVHDRDAPLGVIAWELDWLSYKPGHGFDGVMSQRWPWIVATTLSLQLTDGLSRYADTEALYLYGGLAGIPVNTSYVVDLRYIDSMNVYDYKLPKQHGPDFAAYVRATPELHTVVIWTVQRFGYAWGFGRATKYLAFLVIFAQMLCICIYTAFVASRKWRCDGWSSLAEWLVLGIQSPRSELLKGHSTNIRDRATFGRTVRIMEHISDGKRPILEISEADTRKSQIIKSEVEVGLTDTAYRRLKAEKKYR